MIPVILLAATIMQPVQAAPVKLAPEYPRFINVKGYGKVPFRQYVERVTQIEWRGQPVAVLRAGAVAVRQYALARIRRYDFIRPTTSDQLYWPVKVSKAVKQAVAETWHWRVVRHGHLIRTPYRSGSTAVCGFMAGQVLYAAGARACARLGWSARRILALYYDAEVRR